MSNYPPHSTVTYAIVPYDDVSPGILPFISADSLDQLRHNVSTEPEDLVLVKWMRSKKPGQAKGPDHPNDLAWTSGEMENNDFYDDGYKHVHWQTPAQLRGLVQYNLDDVAVIMAGPEWDVDLDNV